MNHDAKDILDFWFHEIDKTLWFKKSDAFDELIEDRFAHLHKRASLGELYTWRSTGKGRLAEIIVLDQFSRNLFRNSGQAFANDTLALALAQEGIEQEQDRNLTIDERLFFYLPFMHSESQLIHEVALELFSVPGLENNYEFERKHKAIIDRFGRYPHRNAILGRESTPEELDFLSQPGSGF